MKLSAQEEYGLRCLLQVARHAPTEHHAPVSIREVAEGEGLSLDYAAKLLRVLRQSGLLDSERGATGGYRLARPPEEIGMADVMRVLDSPLYHAEFCQNHSGQRECCVHKGTCTLRPLWQRIEAAVYGVLAGVTLANLLPAESAPELTGGESWPRAK